MSSGLVHFLGAITFGYATYYQFWQIKIPAGEFPAMTAWGGRWKYLTIWNLVLHLIYHIYSLANDFVGSNEINKKRQTTMQKIRDNLFASWIFPTGIFVSVTFWGLYAIDRELVFPRVIDTFYPTWLNHAVHTGPITFLTLEVVTVPKIFPERSTGFSGTMTLSLAYLGWITYLYNRTGYWPYPILQILNNFQRILFLAALAIALGALYFLGEHIQKLRWNDEVKSHAAGSEKVKSGKSKSVKQGKKKWY